MNKGIFKQVKGNMVNIDGKWYDGSSVVSFIPKSLNREVTFDADENNNLKFIKVSQSKQQQQNSYKKNNYNVIPQSNSNKNDIIAKQVIFKAAIEEHKLFPDKSLREIYDELISEFYNELV